MKRDNGRVRVHLKIPGDLRDLVENSSKASGRFLSKTLEYCLDVILPIYKQETRFHVAPTNYVGSVQLQHHVKINLKTHDLEFLRNTSALRGLSVDELIRQLVWATLELLSKLSKPEMPLQEEMLREMIKQELELRWQQTYQQPSVT